MKHNALRMAGWIALVLAGGVQAEDYTYTTNLDHTITITGYTGPGGNVVIPAETNGRPVTVIGDSAFYDLTSLTGITIPSSVTNINDFAFQDCASLTNVTFAGGSVALRISGWAFDSCTGLTGITIPANATITGGGEFWGCTSLTAITVDPGNLFYSSVDGVLIDTVNDKLIRCPEGKTGSITVPAGVTVIGEYAFYNCTSLTSVTIPGSVTALESGAFYKCIGLTALYFRGDAPALGDAVFRNVTATVYYLEGTSGWDEPFGGLTAVPWIQNLPQIQLGPGFGMRTNGFGFTVTGSNGAVVVVEASTNLTGGGWKALKTNTLSGGSFLFRDPQATNYSRRFYRLLNRE